MTPPQLDCGRTFSAVMPSVKPAIRLCVTSWQVVWKRPGFGRRSPGTASISFRLSYCFMPIGRVRIFSRSCSLTASVRSSAAPTAVSSLISGGLPLRR